jgi:hypothetical protein
VVGDVGEEKKEKEGGGVGNSERVGFDFERSVDVEVEDEGRDYNDTSQRKNNRLGKRTTKSIHEEERKTEKESEKKSDPRSNRFGVNDRVGTRLMDRCGQ